jgi:hypothetical protein
MSYIDSMLDDAQRELEAALSSTFFPRLVFDPGYAEFLREAGIPARPGLSFSSLTPQQRADLKNLAKMRVSLFIGTIRSKMAIDEGSAKFAMLRTCDLYRVANSGDPGSPSRMWWFTQDIWDQCQREAGPSDTKRVVWLHDHLAVCYDWSTCDRIVRLNTDLGLPVIQALGLPKTRFDSPRMINPTLPGIVHKATIHGGLKGGLMQTILPFIPRLEIRDLKRFDKADVGNPYLR